MFRVDMKPCYYLKLFNNNILNVVYTHDQKCENVSEHLDRESEIEWERINGWEGAWRGSCATK